MYVPAAFAETDAARLYAFTEAYDFGLLVTQGPGGPAATHVPFLLDADPGPPRLTCHVARENPQWRGIEAAGPVLVVFSGPHAYVSPTWYESRPAVPTWNYEAVHAAGPARAVHDPAALRAMLARLTERYEAGRPGGWSMERMPEAYISGMIGGIVGIEVTVERLEGKRKLSQNRTAADRAGVIAGLNATDDPGAHAVARAMALLAEDA
jgi:transcriptional regulator